MAARKPQSRVHTPKRSKLAEAAHEMTEILTKFVYTSEYAIGQRVFVDSDNQTVRTVIGLLFDKTESATVKIAWWKDGEQKVEWVEEWRLTKAE